MEFYILNDEFHGRWSMLQEEWRRKKKGSGLGPTNKKCIEKNLVREKNIEGIFCLLGSGAQCWHSLIQTLNIQSSD